MSLEHVLRRAEGRYAPKVLSEELYFHRYLRGVSHPKFRAGMPLFGLCERGTITKGRPFSSDQYLVFRVPKDRQIEFFELARPGSTYEPTSGVWGYALKTPVPPELYEQANIWLRDVTSSGKVTPAAVLMEDVRYLPAHYLFTTIQVAEITYETHPFLGTATKSIPQGITLTEDVPNHSGITANDIQKAIIHFTNHSFFYNNRDM